MSADTAYQIKPLSGVQAIVAGMVLAISNFMVVLDTTIANVSVPHIAGALAISPSQGTWIITSYAVAEAICVPLTGWLAARFGTVRLFLLSMAGFGIFSALCGLSNSLAMLVACRIGQGLCGGPLMPLTQTLLMRIYSTEQRATAMGLWAMTTVTAPILGPIFGGWISDGWSWHWIFFINVPVVALALYGGLKMLASSETPIQRQPIDRIGLLLMLIWIGALQIMLDLGREHDWFADPLIVVLGLTALIGLVVFVIWEATDPHPIVDLNPFRHRGFSTNVIVMALAFAAFYASVVILPQWMQVDMGYTATWAGYATATTGIGALIMSPIVAKMTERYDPRWLVFVGLLWVATCAWLRTHWTSEADFWTLALPQLLQGFGMPLFFIPVTVVGLGAVSQREMASAAGIMSFVRTMAGAVGTSIAISFWDDSVRMSHNQLANVANVQAGMDTLAASGVPQETARSMVDAVVSSEAVMIGTNHVFLWSTVAFVLAAFSIWICPRPPRKVDLAGAH